MINVIASIKIKDGGLDEFLKIFQANVPTVLEEKGCIEYSPTVDLSTNLSFQTVEKDVVTVIEKWSSLEALNDHLAAPHMLSYKEKVKDLVVDLSIKILTEPGR